MKKTPVSIISKGLTVISITMSLIFSMVPMLIANNDDTSKDRYHNSRLIVSTKNISQDTLKLANEAIGAKKTKVLDTELGLLLVEVDHGNVPQAIQTYKGFNIEAYPVHIGRNNKKDVPLTGTSISVASSPSVATLTTTATATTTTSATPNDPLYSKQWGLNNTGQTGGKSDADIDAPEAWNSKTSASEIVVAVIGSGIRYTHEDLAANMWKNPGEIANNNIDDDKNGYIDDVYGIDTTTDTGKENPIDRGGWGTNDAGVIGAVGNNGKGIAGVAWKVKLMALKFSDPSYEIGPDESDLIRCINYARSKKANIVFYPGNVTFGYYSKPLRDAIESLKNSGIIFVTGGDGGGVDTDLQPSYPANYSLSNIVVASHTDKNDLFTGTPGGESLDLVAPGIGIQTTSPSSNSSYAIASGADLSAAFVTGALALIKSKFPNEDYVRTLNRLYKSTDVLSSLRNKCRTQGRLNLSKALATTSASPVNDAFEKAITLSGNVANGGGLNVDATKQSGEPNHAGNAGGKSFWWKWKAPISGRAEINTKGSTFDTLLAVYKGSSVSSLTKIASNNNDPDGGVYSRVAFNVVSGTTYYIAVDGNNGLTGSAAVRLRIQPGNDNFANAQAITLTNGYADIAGYNGSATKESGEPDHAGNVGGHSIWFKWKADTTGSRGISTLNSNFNTLLAVYTGSSVSNLSLVTSNDDIDPTYSTHSQVNFNAIAGTTYYIAVDGYEGESGDVQLSIW
jgi:hypothetical protein